MEIEPSDCCKKQPAKPGRQPADLLRLWQIIAGILAVLLIINVVFDVRITPRWSSTNASISDQTVTEDTFSPDPDTLKLSARILPQKGFELPITWGDLGKQMVTAGVIDADKMRALYAERGGMSSTEEEMLAGESNKKLRITSENAGFMLNMFWALGIGTKNPILEQGPMQETQYGGAGQFASTGGWTLAKGNPMDHYSKHEFITLTDKQQELVERISKSIYRPCCNNSTYFPDCNHGMAMLGLLELLVAQDVPEEDIYRTALTANAYWFPNNYLTIAQFLEKQGTSWEKADPKELLSAPFSSISGYQEIVSKTQPVQIKTSGGCSV